MVFRATVELFLVLPKFDWKKIFQKFQKKIVQEGSNPKDFICRLDLSNGLGLRPRKEKSRFGCFWTSQWAFENPTFSPVVHKDSRPADGQKSISLSIL
jgi:hypothetical protein